MKKLFVVLLAPALVLLFTSIGYAELDDDLVAYYPFEYNANDASGNSRHGINRGAVFAQGVVGKAASFDGIDDYIQIPTGIFNGLLDVTTSAWVKFDEIQCSLPTVISSLQSSVAHYYSLMTNSNTISFVANFPSNKSYSFDIPFIFDKNCFHHIAVVKRIGDSEGEFKLFVDGEEIHSEVHADFNLPIRYQDGGTIGIGAQDPLGESPARPFYGKIDEVRIYSRALSASEIGVLFSSGYQECSDLNLADTDQDGIVDEWDVCSGTPPGSFVDKNGCPLTETYYPQVVEEMITQAVDHAEEAKDEIIAGMYTEEEVEIAVAERCPGRAEDRGRPESPGRSDPPGQKKK